MSYQGFYEGIRAYPSYAVVRNGNRRLRRAVAHNTRRRDYFRSYAAITSKVSQDVYNAATVDCSTKGCWSSHWGGKCHTECCQGGCWDSSNCLACLSVCGNYEGTPCRNGADTAPILPTAPAAAPSPPAKAPPPSTLTTQQPSASQQPAPVYIPPTASAIAPGPNETIPTTPFPAPPSATATPPPSNPADQMIQQAQGLFTGLGPARPPNNTTMTSMANPNPNPSPSTGPAPYGYPYPYPNPFDLSSFFGPPPPAPAAGAPPFAQPAAAVPPSMQMPPPSLAAPPPYYPPSAAIPTAFPTPSLPTNTRIPVSNSLPVSTPAITGDRAPSDILPQPAYTGMPPAAAAGGAAGPAAGAPPVKAVPLIDVNQWNAFVQQARPYIIPVGAVVALVVVGQALFGRRR